MKTGIINVGYKVLIACLAVLTSVTAFAQDVVLENKASSSSNTTTTTWYAAPWVWIVGAAVFILLLAAIVRGSGKRAD
jgi:hypothetical protein